MLSVCLVMLVQVEVEIAGLEGSDGIVVEPQDVGLTLRSGRLATEQRTGKSRK